MLGRITTHNTSSISEHATGVAGLIVANPNNGGIVGINWYSPLNSYSFTDISDNLDDRIIQAKNDGNKVISLSHGSDEFLEEPYGALFSIYNSNITFIKSMENNLGSGISHPANHHGIIAVGSSTKSNTRSNFSNYGNHIKFLAPGGEGYGYPNNLNILTTSSTDYFYNSGTSYSAPLVAGSVGLLLALRNDLSNDDIENLLILSCDKLPEMGANNWTDRHGYGRINFKKALDFLQTPFQLIHFSSTGGIVYSTSDLYQLNIFSGESGLGTGVYWVKRYELRKTINFPTSYDHFVWGRGSETNGWSLAQPNHGMKFCEILNYNSNSVTLRTYVYEVWNTSSYFGFYPASPQNVTFSFTVLGKPLVAPVIANITQNPVPIYKGTYGYVYCNLS